MKKKIVICLMLSLTVSFLIFTSFSFKKTVDISKYSTEGMVFNYTVSQDEGISKNAESSKDSYKDFSPCLGKSFVGFKEALAFKESGGNYRSINTYGYLGKYQFGKNTLKLIGVYNVEQFLKDPKLQEKAFIANSQRNKWILRREIKSFVGKRINGTIVTESGILAAAHLAGAGNVQKYLRSYGIDNFVDGYGTTAAEYLKLFSGYDTSFLKPKKKAQVSSI